MKRVKYTLKKTWSAFALFIAVVALGNAQQVNLKNQESSLQVLGTSSLHDWEVVAKEQSGSITFKDMEAAEIEKISFEVIAESLKSGKSGMDKNIYKALNTNAHKKISYQLVTVKGVEAKGNGKFNVKTEGDLTISGTKKRVPLGFTLEISGGKVRLTGEKKLKMTDFNVTPPKALMGTITTGNDITVKFNTVFNK